MSFEMDIFSFNLINMDIKYFYQINFLKKN